MGAACGNAADDSGSDDSSDRGSLPNGIKLIVQPETISNSVTVLGHVKNNADLETPYGQEGISSVLDELFAYGTHTFDRIAFQKALDDIGAENRPARIFL